jgi:diguanylate cyclase (GGDEF)-like protein
MPRTTREAAAAACERLRAAVAAEPIPLPSGAAVTATVSLGLVLGAERDGAQLLHEADRALYEAKQAGRNRLAIAA